MKNIGLQIKKIRQQKNLSQERFGYKIGVTGKTISSYERGRSIPPLKVLEQISEIYDVSLVKIKLENKTILDKKISEIEKTITDIKRLINSGISL